MKDKRKEKYLGGFWKPDREAYLAGLPTKSWKVLQEQNALKRKKLRRAKIDAFFYSQEWKTLRYRALLNYGRRCSCCGATPEQGKRMHVDHIKPRSKYPELALEITNLQILCEDCNIGKGAWDQTNFRSK